MVFLSLGSELPAIMTSQKEFWNATQDHGQDLRRYTIEFYFPGRFPQVPLPALVLE